MITDFAVIVPAHNEEDEIGSCLAGLARARRHAQHNLHTRVRVRVCVVLDACADSTESIALAAGDCEQIAVACNNVGAARAAGVRHLLTATATPPGRVWVASTDADSVVPVDWIAQMVHLADAGADVILGTVVPGAGLAPEVEAAWRRRHRLRDGHGHVHGANLGIRGGAYLDLGGWPELATGEDVTLAKRATHAGHLRIVRTGAIPVRTSSRLTSRTRGGFAEFLRDLHTMPAAG